MFVGSLGAGDSLVEEVGDVLGELIVERVEIDRHRFLQIESCELLAGVEQFVADFADGLHVDIDFDAEAVGEYIDELNSGSSRAAAKPPDVGVEDVDAVDHGHD